MTQKESCNWGPYATAHWDKEASFLSLCNSPFCLGSLCLQFDDNCPADPVPTASDRQGRNQSKRSDARAKCNHYLVKRKRHVMYSQWRLVRLTGDSRFHHRDAAGIYAAGLHPELFRSGLAWKPGGHSFCLPGRGCLHHAWRSSSRALRQTHRASAQADRRPFVIRSSR
jgi:hypothetical protein